MNLLKRCVNKLTDYQLELLQRVEYTDVDEVKLQFYIEDEDEHVSFSIYILESGGYTLKFKNDEFQTCLVSSHAFNTIVGLVDKLTKTKE